MVTQNEEPSYLCDCILCNYGLDSRLELTPVLYGIRIRDGSGWCSDHVAPVCGACIGTASRDATKLELISRERGMERWETKAMEINNHQIYEGVYFILVNRVQSTLVQKRIPRLINQKKWWSVGTLKRSYLNTRPSAARRVAPYLQDMMKRIRTFEPLVSNLSHDFMACSPLYSLL